MTIYSRILYSEGKIMVSYAPLWQTLKEKEITTYALIHKYGINPQTIDALKHDKGISIYTLDRLCLILNCTPNDVIEIRET